MHCNSIVCNQSCKKYDQKKCIRAIFCTFNFHKISFKHSYRNEKIRSRKKLSNKRKFWNWNLIRFNWNMTKAKKSKWKRIKKLLYWIPCFILNFVLRVFIFQVISVFIYIFQNHSWKFCKDWESSEKTWRKLQSTSSKWRVTF